MLAIEPFSHALTGASVSASIVRDVKDNALVVTLVVTHHADGTRVHGEELQAELLDASGDALKILAHPQGPLSETGGNLGMSAHGVFRFAGDQASAALLVVTYHGEQARFAVVRR